jgi:hydroxyacylglutathione hydrolase
MAMGFTTLLLAAGLLVGCSDTPPPQAASNIPADQRQVIDTRGPAEFAAGHDPGAINLQWGWNQLEGRVAAYFPDKSTPIALRSGEHSAGSLAELRRAGYQDVLLLEGPVGDETLSTMTTAELAQRLAAGDDLIVIDVRTQGEWDKGVIEGAITYEQDEAPAHLADLDPSKEYAIICAGGYRSGQFASLLRRSGFERVHNVIDGMSGWYAREEK